MSIYKFSIILLFITSWLPSTAQNNEEFKFKTITKTYEGITEQYQIIKKSGRKKHGPYVKFKRLVFYFGAPDNRTNIAILEEGQYNHNLKTGSWNTYYPTPPYNTLQESGSYMNGQKHGLWTTYWNDSVQSEVNSSYSNAIFKQNSIELDIKQKLLVAKAKGVYYNNQKMGAWIYYNYDGSPSHKIDHSSNILLWAEHLNEDSIKNNHPLTFIGGLNHFRDYIYSNMGRPRFASDPVSDSVIFKVTIDKEGHVENIDNISENKSPSNLKEKLKKIISNSDGNWVPAKVNGEYKISTFKIHALLDVKHDDGDSFYEISLMVNADIFNHIDSSS